jgi:hypothetical protein
VQVLKPLIVEEISFELLSVYFNGRADLCAALSTTTSTYIHTYMLILLINTLKFEKKICPVT